MNAPLQLEPARRRERHKFTLDDVFRMLETGILPSEPRVELIEGELVEMAAQNAPHMLAKQALNRMLARLEPAISYHVEGTLKLSETSSPTPDIFVHPPQMRPDEVRGPDTLLVIEVSDSTLRDDLGEKAALYAKHGVPEYWVLDCNRRALFVHKHPVETAFASVKEAGPTELVTPERLPQFGLRLSDLPPF